MRKLISLLAAITLTASASASLIACSQIQPKAKKPAVYDSQDINILLKQVSKAYYLNSDKTINYDFNFVYENMIKNKWIKELDKSAEASGKNGIDNTSRISDIQSVYFGDQIINSKLKDKSEIKIVAGQAPKNLNLLMNLSGIYPTLISFINNGQIIELVLYLVDLGINVMPQIISDQGILDYAAALLPDANIKKLAEALNPPKDKYKNYTMEEVLNSAIVDFGNALNIFAGKDQRYKNSSSDEANKWRASALNGVVLAMQDLPKQSNINLNIVDNWDALCGVINFARVMVIYLNNFAAQRLTVIENTQGTIKELSWDELQKIRNTKYEKVNNELDIKNFIKYLDKAFNDESGKELQNLLQFLFRGQKNYKQVAGSLPIPDIDGFISNFTNKVYDDVGLSGVFKAILNGTSTPEKPIGSMLVGGLGLVSSNNNIVGKLSEKVIKPLIITALKAAVAVGTINEKTANLIIDLMNKGVLLNPWDVTWESFLNPFMDKQLNPGKKVNILGFPISGDYTIRTLLNRLTYLTTTENNDSLKLDFKNLSDLINQLQGVIKVAQENPKELLTKLGYIRPSKNDEDVFIKSGSFFDYLNRILNDTKGSNGLFNALNVKTEEFKDMQAKLREDMQAKFNSVEVSSEKQIDHNTFEYIINNKTITIKIDVVKNKYSITAISMK
ncbi:hypothetical protein CG007_01725 [Mesoplasma entomophilum]|uniref:lipoprotein n=1 Tax=Mesoplasma entomophilum TaxID=2149 RepID=UPI000D035066|nr:lipoprotein [Mesoplasma entomophilum]AVN60335.1 hypothetical protein CG007_01725 [Mesoplasma entomophilum]